MEIRKIRKEVESQVRRNCWNIVVEELKKIGAEFIELETDPYPPDYRNDNVNFWYKSIHLSISSDNHFNHLFCDILTTEGLHACVEYCKISDMSNLEYKITEYIKEFEEENPVDFKKIIEKYQVVKIIKCNPNLDNMGFFEGALPSPNSDIL